jgi:uncharacterized membrane protein YdbT with pleckstrin-like domain
MKELLRSEILSDEKLVWEGRPKSGVMVKPSDIFMIPFSLLWGGFAIFWGISVTSSDAPFFFSLFGIPFVLIGLYIIFGRFFFDAKKRGNTIYGLTDKRAIIISGVFGKKTTSLNLKSLQEVQVSKNRMAQGQ